MNKLRINPGGNKRNQNRGSETEQKRQYLNSEENNDIIQYFLDKNSSEFAIEDLEKFQLANQKNTDLFISNSNKVIVKLFSISKSLAERSNAGNENRLDILALLPEAFIELSPLISEVIEDGVGNNTKFLTTLIDELDKIDEELKKEVFSIDNLYGRLSEMLQSLQEYNITQQKYIYRSIAKSLNQHVSGYNLVSPEDGNFVDLKFHNTISGSGQRISRGLSFILLDANTDEVLKFGNVKTI
jgi:hypothetical protein